MSLILSGFSIDELERYAEFATPELAEAARRELSTRGPAELERVRDEIERLAA